MDIRFEKIHPDAILPKYAHGSHQDAGLDIFALEGFWIDPKETGIVKTGFKMSMLAGVQAEIRSRSGLSLKGIVVANAPATIDPSYRGEVGVIMYNRGTTSYYIAKHDRIAQMVIMPYIQADVVEGPVDDYPSLRGAGGFGSTGDK